MNRFYTVWASLIVTFYAFAVWWGFSFSSVDEVKGIPKSVRDNPGSYRSHYASRPHHFFGGK